MKPPRRSFVAGGIGMAPLFFAAAQRQRAGLPFEFILEVDSLGVVQASESSSEQEHS